MRNWEERILVGITCTNSRRKKDHWKEQIKEINKLKITVVALFPTLLTYRQRKKMYAELEKSCIKQIKLVHIRGQDFTAQEIDYLMQRFKCKLFNCHEDEFDRLYNKWPQFRKNVVLELNYDNKIKNRIVPNKMGGFCIDLAHFWSARQRNAQEYDYTIRHLRDTKLKANHLNGYSQRRKRDLHFVNKIIELDYLTKIPKELFSDVIGLEMENTIAKQLEYKKYIIKILSKRR